MVGQGALREALLDARVSQVITVVRGPSGQSHPKLREIVHRDFTRLEGLDLRCDACFFAIGVTSAGMSEEDYTKVTYDTAMAAAKAVLSPTTTFVFVSGAGADGDSMWARVKRRAEQDLSALPFKAVYVFRPAFIRPMHGIKSRTPMYNTLYALLFPLTYLVPSRVKSTTENLGRAMLNVAANGFEKPLLNSPEINQAAASPA
ncbi:MAG: epimerase [Myxococcales bacterium]